MNYKTLNRNSYIIGDYSIFPIRKEDMESIRVWRNKQMSVLRQKKELTSEDQQRYFDEVIFPLFSKDQPEQLLFSLVYNNELIGYGGLTNISWIDKRAEMSFLVSDQRAADKTLYKEDFVNFIVMLKVLMFEEMKFNRLFTETYEFRLEHIKILEESGFILEGILRQVIFDSNRFYNSYIHSVLKKDYERIKE